MERLKYKHYLTLLMLLIGFIINSEIFAYDTSSFYLEKLEEGKLHLEKLNKIVDSDKLVEGKTNSIITDNYDMIWLVNDNKFYLSYDIPRESIKISILQFYDNEKDKASKIEKILNFIENNGEYYCFRINDENKSIEVGTFFSKTLIINYSIEEKFLEVLLNEFFENLSTLF